ncbi:MAG: HAD family hydrolase [Promethearchaeota archaeon]|nr:MAG: HAD family hydrolase [Candidatus Lokiarchaeota archaeon]
MRAVIEISKIKGLIFDFGFTLFYFEEASLKKYINCYQKGLQKSVDFLFRRNILKTESIKKEFINKFNRMQNEIFKERNKGHQEYPTRTLFRRICRSMNLDEDINEEVWEELPNLFHSFEEEEWIPFENTHNTLTQLKKVPHLKLAVLSNHPHHTMIEQVLNRYNLSQFFDEIITSAEYGMRKPHIDIFDYTIKKLGIKKEDKKNIIMCGDEYADIMGAHRAGLQIVLIEREYKFPYEKDIPLKDICRIKDISEILNLI